MARDDPQTAPEKTIFGRAVNAQWTSATFKDRLKRVGRRVRGAMGKEKGRLKTLSSRTTTLADADVSIDLAAATTPQDRVAIVATEPMTRDEAWHPMQTGELRVFVGGKLAAYWRKPAFTIGNGRRGLAVHWSQLCAAGRRALRYAAHVY